MRDFFYKHLIPLAIQVGMPLQEFWYDEPDLLWAYRNAYIEKEKQKTETQKEMINFQSWLQGYYNSIAIGSVFSKDVHYLSEPIELNPKPKTQKEKNLEIAQKVKNKIKRGKKILEQQRGEKKG